jgi:pimeloyl-ACP methyl ester carboxylesterase
MSTEKSVLIDVESAVLPGDLVRPSSAGSLVIFAHGSGSSRLSTRNRFVAEQLQKGGIATLLFDLLTEEEDETYENRFDIPLLTDRLVSVTQWVMEEARARKFGTLGLPIGYFGASTGAAAALGAAASLGAGIGAVVSRGGRPDLAMESLAEVRAPTLLIVGGRDDVVIELNRKAYDLMKAEKELSIVPGATHLFEEPGALEEVARLAGEWFIKYLPKR